jgi:hypothetical protein
LTQLYHMGTDKARQKPVILLFLLIDHFFVSYESAAVRVPPATTFRSAAALARPISRASSLSPELFLQRYAHLLLQVPQQYLQGDPGHED